MAAYVDLAIVALLVILGMVFWFLRISYETGIVFGIALLFVSTIWNWVGYQDVSNLIGIFAYYFLLIGVLLAVLKLRQGPVELSGDQQTQRPETEALMFTRYYVAMSRGVP